MVRFKLCVFTLFLCSVQVVAAEQLDCIQWDQKNPTVFQPVANSNNQIAPDYGLYWIKYDPKTGGEDYKRAYTPDTYLPYFSDGTRNTNPDPATDGGAARTQYNTSELQGFYDPKKPTIILFHGWQPGMTQDHRRIDLCYRYPTGVNSYSPLYNTLKYWQGWNVAIFYWNQFADESGFKDAEAKLYSSSVLQTMRWAYLTAGDTNVHYCMAQDSHCIMPRDAAGRIKTIAELGYEAVVNALPAMDPQEEFRIAGQSFGAQLAILVTDKLLTSQSTRLKPTRLVLLDPYFSRGNLANLFNGQSVVNHVNAMVQEIETYQVPVAEYRTSKISYFPTGDCNSWLMSHTAYERFYPKYLDAISGLDLLAEQHRSAIYLYFQSNRAAPYWDRTTTKNWNRSYINAQASNVQVSQLMHFARAQIPGFSEYSFPNTQDDAFTAVLAH